MAKKAKKRRNIEILTKRKEKKKKKKKVTFRVLLRKLKNEQNIYSCKRWAYRFSWGKYDL